LVVKKVHAISTDLSADIRTCWTSTLTEVTLLNFTGLATSITWKIISIITFYQAHVKTIATNFLALIMRVRRSSNALKAFFKLAWFITTITILVVSIITFIVVIVKWSFATNLNARPRLLYKAPKALFNFALIWTSVTHIIIQCWSIWVFTLLPTVTYHYPTSTNFITSALTFAALLNLTVDAAQWLFITWEPAIVNSIAKFLAGARTVAYTSKTRLHLTKWGAAVSTLGISIVTLIDISQIQSVSATLSANWNLAIIWANVSFLDLTRWWTSIKALPIAIIALFQRLQHTISA